MSLSSNDLKSGMTIFHNGSVHQVVEAHHIKPGKRHAFVRTKLKNLTNGSIFEINFRDRDDIEQAIVEKRVLQYLYRDKDLFYFMDPESYEQIPVNKEVIEHTLDYLKEQGNVTFTFYEERVLEASLPDFIALKVTEALPGLKGDTVQGGTKPVTLETGKVVQVPLFINEGDYLKIDTRTGKYVERTKV